MGQTIISSKVFFDMSNYNSFSQSQGFDKLKSLSLYLKELSGMIKYVIIIIIAD